MGNRNIKIESKQDYNATMNKIDALMKIGEKNITDTQLKELETLALAAHEYEKSMYEIPSSK
jgi:HTH-type transcriptional regulator / antitoxin HigA